MYSHRIYAYIHLNTRKSGERASGINKLLCYYLGGILLRCVSNQMFVVKQYMYEIKTIQKAKYKTGSERW